MILNTDFFIVVKREKESYDYKFDKNKNDFQNNIKNNMLDSLKLLYKNDVVFECDKVQTVSNHPEYDHKDTVAPGSFQIKCFVPQGGYVNQVHGIINAKDIEDQVINSEAKQWEDNHMKGRWLIHDTIYQGKRLNHAWSGACFMMFPEQLISLNELLKKYNITSEHIINGKLEEEVEEL